MTLTRRRPSPGATLSLLMMGEGTEKTHGLLQTTSLALRTRERGRE